jgi:hypothetical protein
LSILCEDLVLAWTKLLSVLAGVAAPQCVLNSFVCCCLIDLVGWPALCASPKLYACLI